ncbi:MAG TPA: hypothetical protein VNZ64_20685 [Candidatus Acidoferrum sp.]|jgi:hypothetical protein|nr:hypothetical protein [Candidatus Acidoferrum sp.]
MKTSPFILASVITLAAASGVSAGDRPKTDKATTTPAAEPAKASPAQTQAPLKEKKVEITGSYVKREVRRNGQITDGMNPVLVIDSKSIQTSGASDLRQLLVRQGVNR